MSTPRIYVPGEGPEKPTFMIIGEAPGFEEEKQRHPFIGGSGSILRYCMSRAGISESEVYITNVCHYRPPANKISAFCKKSKKLGYQPNDLVREGLYELYSDISRLQPRVIIPVGNVALWATTGLDAILKRRGSILRSNLDVSRVLHVEPYFNDQQTLNTVLKANVGQTVIPTIHPAAVMRQYALKPIFEFDLKRARQASTRNLVPPTRDIIIDPPYDEAVQLADLLLRSGRYAADIETPGNSLYCIGFSCDPSWGVVFRYDEPWKRELVRELLESPAKKIFQNGTFDCSFLRLKENINVQNYYFDTMFFSKLVYPEFKAGLDFLASFYTLEPYYKDEGKDHDLRHFASAEEYMRYCGKDACVTLEVANSIEANEYKKEPHRLSIDSHRNLLPIATDMAARGINIDKAEVRRLSHEYSDKLTATQHDLDIRVLQDLLKIVERSNNKKALDLAISIKTNLQDQKPGFNVASNKDVMLYLYELRGFPVKRNKDTRQPTADEKALKELYGETGDETLLLIVKCREYRKVKSSYLNYKLAPTGRLFFSVNPVATKTQRWSTGQTIVMQVRDAKNKLQKTGLNAQTMPPNLRSVIIPDKGYLLGYSDLSQVEDRIVAYTGGVLKKIYAFENDIDAHSLTATAIFKTTIEEVKAEAKRCKAEGKTPPMRYLGKQSNHAMNYGERERTFMLNVNKRSDETGIRINFSDAKAIRTAHFDFYPEIETGYWPFIAEQLYRNRTIRNPFGYERTFHSCRIDSKGKIDDASMRDAYSWYPQSTAPEIINRGMARIASQLPQVQILLHAHDAILWQAPANEAEDIQDEVIRLMDEPLYIGSRVIHIPVDSKIGERWSRLG